jgi:methylmalonyl-CoA epimerase
VSDTRSAESPEARRQPSAPRPLGTVDHVAIAVRPESKDAAIRFLTEILGATPGFGKDETVFSFRHFHLGAAKFELLWPTTADSFLTRFLDKRGEGLHHITMTVDDVKQKCDWLESEGLNVVDKDFSVPYWMQAFISPRSAFGVLFQLAQKGQRAAGTE